MVDWWRFAIGILGVIGVAGQGLADWGSWLVGLAFLTLFVRSFAE